MSLAIVTILSLIAQLDLRDALIQRSRISRVHVQTTRLVLSISSIGWGGLLFTLSPWFESNLGMPGLADLVRIMCLIILIEAFEVPFEALLIRGRALSQVAMANLLSYALGFGATGILMAYFFPGPMALATAYIAMTAVRCFFMAAFLNKQRRAAAIADVHVGNVDLREVLDFMFRHSFLGTANRFFAKFIKQLDNAMVGVIAGAQALGLYSRAYTLAIAPVDTLLGLTVRSVVFPALAAMETDTSRFNKAAQKGLFAGAATMLPISATLCVLGPETIGLLLGGGAWTAAVFPFQCLTMAMGLRYALRLVVAIGRARGNLLTVFWLNFLTTVCLAAFVWLGTVVAGINGAAVGVVFVSVIQWSGSLLTTAKICRSNFSDLLSMHLGPFALIAIYAGVMWIAANFLRMNDAPEIAVLAIAPIAAASAPILLLSCIPGRFLQHWQQTMLKQMLVQAGKAIPGFGHLLKWSRALIDR